MLKLKILFKVVVEFFVNLYGSCSQPRTESQMALDAIMYQKEAGLTNKETLEVSSLGYNLLRNARYLWKHSPVVAKELQANGSTTMAMNPNSKVIEMDDVRVVVRAVKNANQ
jgi:hypothetical protein